MNEETRNKIKNGMVKIPDGWTVIYEEDVALIDEHMCWNWPDETFYDLSWWRINDPTSLMSVNYRITPAMVVIRPIKSEEIKPKEYVPEKPKKQTIMKNIKLLIKR